MSRSASGPPLILLSVQPKGDDHRANLDTGLRRLTDEDPTLSVEPDQLGNVIIGARGELELEIILDRLKREFGVEAFVGRPQVARREAPQRSLDGEPCYEEPVMHIEVTVPTANVADVVNNLLSRGALIHANDAGADTHVIRALVQLSEMFGYGTDLRSRTFGRATHSMTFAHWQLVRDAPDRSDGDLDSLVGAPLRPKPLPRDSAIAMPEPDDD